MKKTLRSLKLACLAAVSMLVVSCGGSADYRNFLPADSFMTMSVNPASLLQKSDAGDIGQHPLFIRLKAELDKAEGITAEEKEYLLALLKNPCESGVDLKKDLFFFMSMDGAMQSPNVRGGMLLPVGDKAKLDALLARIGEKSGIAPRHEGGVSVIALGEDSSVSGLCAYNDVAVMLYFAQGSPESAIDAVKKLFAQKCGVMTHDPFLNHHFHLEPVDRGFLTDEEIQRIMQKDFEIPRLEMVRDVFIFSCFCGLAYIDVAHLTQENIITLDNRPWIIINRQKTNVQSNIPLLEIPQMILDKYKGKTKDNRLLPVLSNQKINAYLKEIADLCGIKKRLSYHLARHTFATMLLSKGVPIESVSKMLGHTNIKTTQIYARITNKKIEQDMMQVADKFDGFKNCFIN